MKQFILIFVIVLFLTCGKSKEEAKSNNQPSSPSVADAPKDFGRLQSGKKSSKLGELKEEAESDESQIEDGKLDSNSNQNSGKIESPTDPISEASKTRLLEYTINLNFDVKDLAKSREELLKIVKKESFITSSNINFYSSYESMSLVVHVPVNSLYDTLLSLSKIGELKNENVNATDWTEHNQLQKIKLAREAERIARRGKAVAKGNSESWTLKDREDALERSEDSADHAKLEAWKIKDKVSWAKINISLQGKELPMKIVWPDFRGAIVESINFILGTARSLVWFIPIIVLLYGLYRLVKFFRKS